MESTNSTSEDSSDYNYSTENNSIFLNLFIEEPRQANFDNNNSDIIRNSLNGGDLNVDSLSSDIQEIIGNRQKNPFATKQMKKRRKEK